jgi:hypothetical protein
MRAPASGGGGLRSSEFAGDTGRQLAKMAKFG